VAIIKALKFPSNITKLKSAIRFFSYYRKFILFFIKIAALLKKLKMIRLIRALFKGEKYLNFAAPITIPLLLPKLNIEDITNKSKKTRRIKRK
jgi:hypothetical protein